MVKTIREVFSNNLIRLRGIRTQARIAEIANISLGGYQKAENGTIPQEKTLAKIAKALNVSESILFLDPDLSPNPSPERFLDLLKRGLKSDVFQKNAAASLVAALRDEIEPPR